MAPRGLLVLRHEEKPSDPADRNLPAAGIRRAVRLARWIPAQSGGHVDFIIASADTDHGVTCRHHDKIPALLHGPAVHRGVSPIPWSDDLLGLASMIDLGPTAAGLVQDF